jgi:hypothetical protein
MVIRETSRFHFAMTASTKYTLIDMGIALGFWTMACECLGLPGTWQVLAEPPASIALPAGVRYIATWAA